MKKLILLASSSVLFYFAAIKTVVGQVSFAPVDTLVYTSAGTTGTYLLGPTYVADFNKDGLDDVLILKGKSIYLQANSGANEFLKEVLLYTDVASIFSVSNFADINNDTYPDVAIMTAQGVKVLVAKDGLLKQEHQSPALPSSGKMILFDYNKDSKIDLVATDAAGRIITFSNVSAGLASQSVIYSGGILTYNFDIRDLNTDGQFDLILTVPSQTLKVLLGAGNNTFTEVYAKTLTSLANFETGDLNLDGHLDIVFLEWNNNIFTLIYKPSTKTFEEKSVFAGGMNTNTSNFKLMDVQNNGTLDLVLTKFQMMTWKEGNASGQFLTETTLYESSMSPFTYFAFNLNNDNVGDLLVSDYNKFEVMAFNGNGSLKTKIVKGYYSDHWDVLFEDMDGDGMKDILAISRTGSLHIHWGRSDRDYSLYTEYKIPLDAYYAAVADVNRDGKKDIILTSTSNFNSNSSLLLLTGQGSRSFSQATPWKYFPGSRMPHILDLDNDGVSEFVSYSGFSPEVVWLRFQNTDYNEYYSPNSKITISAANVGIGGMTAGDLNKDGFIDLVTANLSSKNLTILTNNKSGSFAQTTLVPNGTTSSVLCVQTFDYNADQFLDLAAIVEQEPGIYTLQIFLNNKSGGFQHHESKTLTGIYSPQHIDWIDIDGDSDNDLIVSAWDYMTTNIFINTDGVFANTGEGKIKNVGQATRLYADLNGDDKPDAFTATFIYGNKFIQLNNSVVEPPSVQSVITLQEIKHKSVKVGLGPTSASGRFVVVTKGNTLADLPEDNRFYSSNLSFGTSAPFNTNSFVVHVGTQTSFEITGLTSSTEYLISVFEYNANEPQQTIINYTQTKVQKLFKTLSIPPQVSPVADLSGEGLESTSVALVVTDEDNRLDELTYTLSSSNPSVVPANNLTVVTAGSSVLLKIQPIDFGQSEITVLITDPANNTASLTIQYSSLIVGLEENKTTAFNVYPNPFTNSVEVSSPITNQRLQVLNAKGELIKDFDAMPLSIELDDVPPGLYIFRTGGRSYKAIKH